MSRGIAATVRLLTMFGLVTMLGAGLTGCSASSSDPKTKVVVEEYPVGYRQFPPDPVYSRLAWSQLPQPIRPKVRENAPLMMPVLSFELPKSNLEEAVQALAQTIGYQWTYPPEAAKRPIAINMVAPVDEILAEVARQASVDWALDHDNRVVRVTERIEAPPVAAALPQIR